MFGFLIRFKEFDDTIKSGRPPNDCGSASGAPAYAA
jgi:hypothetical protein